MGFRRDREFWSQEGRVYKMDIAADWDREQTEDSCWNGDGDGRSDWTKWVVIESGVMKLPLVGRSLCSLLMAVLDDSEYALLHIAL